MKRTPLHALHLSLGAKMVGFAGYEMPEHYASGALEEHRQVREHAGLFDVSHMGQAMLSGNDPARALERLTPADLTGLRDGQMRYALLLNERGGIKDDFTAARLPDERALYLAVNAGTTASDFAFIAEHLKGAAQLLPQSRALLALQGPKAESVLARHAQGIATLGFMKIARVTVAGAPAILSRSGYTGEDGFEMSLEEADAERVARALLGEPEVLPIGLAARDSLRLEAGLCLYGQDIDETVSPIAAGLAWTIGKRRKLARDFPAQESLMTELLEGTKRKRVGLQLHGEAPARAGEGIVDAKGNAIGRVTSSRFGPSVGAAIAMAYVDAAFAADGTDVRLSETSRPAMIVPMPFVPHRYKKKALQKGGPS